MKSQPRGTQRIARLIAVEALAAIRAFADATHINALAVAEPPTLLPRTCATCGQHSGRLAIAAFQSARLKVVTVGNPDTLPVAVEMKFYEATGAQLAQSRVSLLPGQSGFLELSHRQLGRAGRMPIRVEVVGFNPQPDPPGRGATLEVYDNLTGRTMLFIGDSDFLAKSQ
jgi:hypothetical protein